MKSSFKGSKIPRLAWEKNLAKLRRRHKLMGNLMFFLACLGCFHLVSEVLCLFGGERLSPVTGLTFSVMFTAITYLALPIENTDKAC